MSDLSGSAPRPVSAITVLAILGCFALFLLVAYYGYLPRQSLAAQATTPEKLPEDQAWRANHLTREAALGELRKKQADQATKYGWVDQKTGVAQLPIGRAMELVVQENGARK
jgi:hypothetical protein